MEQSAVLLLFGRPVEEVDAARVPALIRFLDPRQVERGQSVVRRRRRPRYASLEILAHVQVILVPDEYRDFHVLRKQTNSLILSFQVVNHLKLITIFKLISIYYTSFDSSLCALFRVFWLRLDRPPRFGWKFENAQNRQQMARTLISKFQWIFNDYKRPDVENGEIRRDRWWADVTGAGQPISEAVSRAEMICSASEKRVESPEKKITKQLIFTLSLSTTVQPRSIGQWSN